MLGLPLQGATLFTPCGGATLSFFDDGKLDINKSQQAGIREKHITYTFLACGLTTSLTEETGTVRGKRVGGGEGGAAAVEAGAGGCEEDGGAGGVAAAAGGAGGAGVLCDSAGSVLPEGEQGTLSVFRSVELSRAGIS